MEKGREVGSCGRGVEVSVVLWIHSSPVGPKLMSAAQEAEQSELGKFGVPLRS